MTEENGYECSEQMVADSKQIAWRVSLCEAADGLRSEATRRGLLRQGPLSPVLAAKFPLEEPSRRSGLEKIMCRFRSHCKLYSLWCQFHQGTRDPQNTLCWQLPYRLCEHSGSFTHRDKGASVQGLQCGLQTSPCKVVPAGADIPTVWELRVYHNTLILGGVLLTDLTANCIHQFFYTVVKHRMKIHVKSVLYQVNITVLIIQFWNLIFKKQARSPTNKNGGTGTLLRAAQTTLCSAPGSVTSCH